MVICVTLKTFTFYLVQCLLIDTSLLALFQCLRNALKMMREWQIISSLTLCIWILKLDLFFFLSYPAFSFKINVKFRAWDFSENFSLALCKLPDCFVNNRFTLLFSGCRCSHNTFSILSELCKKYLCMVENRNVSKVLIRFFSFFSGFTHIGILYVLLYCSSGYSFSFSLLPRNGQYWCRGRELSFSRGWLSFFCVVSYKVTSRKEKGTDPFPYFCERRLKWGSKNCGLCN